MNKKYVIGAILASRLICSFAEYTPKYLDYSAPLEERVEDALSRMTLEEKVKMVHAQSKFSSAGVPTDLTAFVLKYFGINGIAPNGPMTHVQHFLLLLASPRRGDRSWRRSMEKPLERKRDIVARTFCLALG